MVFKMTTNPFLEIDQFLLNCQTQPKIFSVFVSFLITEFFFFKRHWTHRASSQLYILCKTLVLLQILSYEKLIMPHVCVLGFDVGKYSCQKDQLQVYLRNRHVENSW